MIPPLAGRSFLAIVCLGHLPAVALADLVDRLESHVAYLAADERAGRAPGTHGHSEAAAYIRRAFEEVGLEPVFSGGYLDVRTTGEGATITNVAGLLRGDPGAEHVLVGAHYDHLGTGPDGEIYNGADDNASGVAALIEIARDLSASSDAPRRSVLFVAFDGEEEGRLGSERYASDPPLPLASCVAMINLDSIGRLAGGRLVVFGAGTADVFGGLLAGLNRVHAFDLATNDEGAGAGDHETFFARGIPVLHLFTDAHLDYHQPTDTPDKIDVEGLARVTRFAHDAVTYLTDDAVILRFVPVGAEKLARGPAGGERRTVTLGTIPDFARTSGGVRISGIVPGSPAEASGLATDDVIVDIDETPIDSLHDYSDLLKTRAPGDVIRITFVRGGERRTVEATLVKRR